MERAEEDVTNVNESRSVYIGDKRTRKQIHGSNDPRRIVRMAGSEQVIRGDRSCHFLAARIVSSQ